MKEYEDTLQVCTMHRVLQTMDEPCEKCLQEFRAEQARRRLQEKIELAAASA